MLMTEQPREDWDNVVKATGGIKVGFTLCFVAALTDLGLKFFNKHRNKRILARETSILIAVDEMVVHTVVNQITPFDVRVFTTICGLSLTKHRFVTKLAFKPSLCIFKNIGIF
jgi:hypothetical protein